MAEIFLLLTTGSPHCIFSPYMDYYHYSKVLATVLSFTDWLVIAKCNAGRVFDNCHVIFIRLNETTVHDNYWTMVLD